MSNAVRTEEAINTRLRQTGIFSKQLNTIIPDKQITNTTEIRIYDRNLGIKQKELNKNKAVKMVIMGRTSE